MHNTNANFRSDAKALLLGGMEYRDATTLNEFLGLFEKVTLKLQVLGTAVVKILKGEEGSLTLAQKQVVRSLLLISQEGNNIVTVEEEEETIDELDLLEIARKRLRVSGTKSA